MRVVESHVNCVAYLRVESKWEKEGKAEKEKQKHIYKIVTNNKNKTFQLDKIENNRQSAQEKEGEGERERNAITKSIKSKSNGRKCKIHRRAAPNHNLRSPATQIVIQSSKSNRRRLHRLCCCCCDQLHSSTFQMQEANDLIQCAEKSMRSLMRCQCKVCSKSNEIIKVQLTIYWCTFRAQNSNNVEQHSKMPGTSRCTARVAALFFRWTCMHLKIGAIKSAHLDKNQDPYHQGVSSAFITPILTDGCSSRSLAFYSAVAICRGRCKSPRAKNRISGQHKRHRKKLISSHGH